jgi:deoxyribonuclease V
MKARKLHKWKITPREAIKIQAGLAGRIISEDCCSRISTVGGVDVGFQGDRSYAAAVVLSYPELRLLEQATASAEVTMAYIPGLLSFREIPALIHLLPKLTATPDVILVDGQGIAHPRGLGLASHLGLIFDVPTIGCAKSRLIGSYTLPAPQKGAHTPLYIDGEIRGAVLRSRENVKPLFISVGHKICLETALSIVLACCLHYRLPEPTRLAHLGTREKK